MSTDTALDAPTGRRDATPARLAAALGHQYSDPQWCTTSDPAIGPDRFGKDHYSTLLYVETRAVDHKGLLDHDHMRCDAARHPMLAEAGKRSMAFGAPSGKYPTRLRRNAAGEVVEQADHDDYDCLDDMVACGWLTVTMPVADHDADVFRDAAGRPVALPGEPPIAPSFYTGMDELILARHAKWALTEEGFAVAAELRKHQAGGGNLVSFANARFGSVTR